MFHYTELGGQRTESGRGREGLRRRMSHSRRRSRAAVSGLTERERATGGPRLRRRAGNHAAKQSGVATHRGRLPSPLVARIAPGERGDGRIQTWFSTKVPNKGPSNREITTFEGPKNVSIFGRPVEIQSCYRCHNAACRRSFPLLLRDKLGAGRMSLPQRISYQSIEDRADGAQSSLI